MNHYVSISVNVFGRESSWSFLLKKTEDLSDAAHGAKLHNSEGFMRKIQHYR